MSSETIHQDLKSVGKFSFSLSEKSKISNDDDYVLGLSGADDTISASLSDRTVRILKFSSPSLTPVTKFKAHEDTITGVRHCPQNSKIILTSSKDGSVRTWDTRLKIEYPVQTFIANSDSFEENIKPINCFDVNPEGTFLCAGTDQVKQEASLIFWDRRSTKVFDSYLDSHTDDITDVCYHSKQKGLMISGSVDGLINVFDVTQTCEDDALLNTINTESSVGKLSWTKEQDLSCITHTEEIQIWNSDDINLICSYTRDTLKNLINKDIDYLVDTLQFPKSQDVFLMSGTSNGAVYLWLLDDDEPSLWTVLVNGHTDVVRCKTLIGDRIVTGGEDGIVCIWQKDIADSKKEPSALKQKLGKHQKKPY